MGFAEVRCISKACALSVGGGILDAPYNGAACKWGVKDAALYAQETILFHTAFENAHKINNKD